MSDMNLTATWNIFFRQKLHCKWQGQIALCDMAFIHKIQPLFVSLVVDFDNEEEYDPEQFAGNQVPIFIVGTKMVSLVQSGTITFSVGLCEILC